jgi:hypothetical protein
MLARLGQKIPGVAVLIFDIDFRYHISRWLGLRMQDAGSANAQNKAGNYSRRNFVVGFHATSSLVACADAGA